MRDIEILNKGVAVGWGEISFIEQLLKVKLPSDYAIFLTRTSGGKVAESCNTYRVPEKYGDFIAEYAPYPYVGVEWFYAWKFPEYVGYELVNKCDDYAGRLPENVIPIGNDSCGNQICLAVAGPGIGAVYFWDHELESVARKDNPFLIADSF